MNTVDRLIELSGGVQRAAAYAERSRTRVWEWRVKGQVPQKVWPTWIANAGEDGIRLTYADFLPGEAA